MTVRSGKGNKYRVVPLNADVRRALAQYLAVRPRVSDDHFFLSQKGGGLQSQAVAADRGEVRPPGRPGGRLPPYPAP